MVRYALSILTGCLAAACLTFAGCGGGSVEPADRRPLIVATTSHVADLARNIAGEHMSVSGMLGPGVDPHSYTLSRADVAQMAKADVILYSGLHLEGRMLKAFENARAGGKLVEGVAEGVPESERRHPPEFPGGADPHVWMDPTLWMYAADRTAQILGEADPAHKADYAANLDAYRAQLEQLRAYAEEVLSTVPAESRVLVTAHDAFGYLGQRFNLEVVGIQGISTESEAGVRDIERIVALLVERKVPAVFVESTVSERNVRALIEGAAARGHEVKIGGQLYSDALGKGGTYEGTYIGMLDHNVTTIARALGGDAPESGMLGRLGE